MSSIEAKSREVAIKNAARLYSIRDSMRWLLGERYPERCREQMVAINYVMQREGCGVMRAVISIAHACASEGVEAGVLWATAVEMCEGMFALPALGSVVSYRSTHPAYPGKVAEGRATVVKYVTAENVPTPHLRPAERMLYVRGEGGPMDRQHFIIKASEVVP